MTTESPIKKLRKESMLLNIGPAHPAMHGIVRIVTELDGETIVNCDVEIGYLHRAFEKSCEQSGYLQAIPYTDRLNYVSPLINNVGYCLAVEKLFDMDTTERAKYIRVIMCELSRITDHLTCVGASAMELGAFTAFLYMIKAREELYQLIEEVTGARLTISYARVGGVKGDLTPDFDKRCREILNSVGKVIDEADQLLTKNRIFVDRLKDLGVISKERALAYGITGPFLRSTGADYDVRRAHPHLVYDQFDFEIPVGTTGDNYDRYLVRMEEMRQSISIVRQALDKIPGGAVMLDPDGNEVPAEYLIDEAKMGHTGGMCGTGATFDPTLQGNNLDIYKQMQPDNKRAILPAKENTYGNIEGLMNHFKGIMLGHGIRPPKGEAYFPVEGANGELGFYIVSDGTDSPYRVRCRPPCFMIMAALRELLIGDTMADIIPTFGSVNMIGGEMDR